MLYIDKNGNIKINRGDTFEVPLFIDVCSNILHSIRYPWKVGDEVILHVMEANKPFECFLLGKSFTYEDLNENSDIIVRFDHEDTNFMVPNTYFYEVKLIHHPDENSDSGNDSEESEDVVVTIVPRRKFIVL